MFFSSHRRKVPQGQDALFVIYLALFLGGVTMVVPFVIMVAGSTEPALRFSDSLFSRAT